MLKFTKEYIMNNFEVSIEAINTYERAISDIEDTLNQYDEIKEYNQMKVLHAFQEERISEAHFTNSTGYGYGDIGRDSLDRVFSKVFNTEAALVRPHFVNGTHAIGAALFGNLRPGDTMLSVCGKPYDTLHDIIGISKNENMGSLKDYGVLYKEIALQNDKLNIEAIKKELVNDKSIKLIHIQRSTGYGFRNALSIYDIKEAINVIKNEREDIIVFIDNCYGEFTDILEPTDIGADLMAGSLIKNVGGGIATTGGYIVGREKCIRDASYRLTTPGIGGECGSTFGVIRTFFQGLFLAPHVTVEAIKGAILISRMMELMGFEVMPKFYTKRSDIIQAVKFNDKEALISFCKGIQKASPIDSFVECEPWDMPGYEDKVIMAAGAFIQGSSIELSADAPIREPYIAYIQGGLTFEHAKIGILIALSKIIKGISF